MATKPKAYGGVVIDGHGRVLLRRPANLYDAYHWSFPKGKADPSETPEQTALREVTEETGWECEIVGELGSFASGLSDTTYYLMRPVRERGDFGRKETEAIAWATPAGARAMIGETQNGKGRERDLAALAACEARVMRSRHRLRRESGAGHQQDQLVPSVSWGLTVC